MNKLRLLGIEIDEERNQKIASFKELNQGIITTENSSIPVYVIPTNEELEIARDTYNLTNNKTLTKVR